MKKYLVILLLLVPSLGYSAPAITSTSGTYTHGQTITISGSNFGTKSPAKPLIWAPFEGGSAAPDSGLSSSPGSYYANSLSVTSSGLESHSTYGLTGTVWNGSTKVTPDYGVTGSGWGKVFSFMRRKWTASDYFTANGNVQNYKWIRLWPPSGLYPDAVIALNNYGYAYTGIFNENPTNSLTLYGGYPTANTWIIQETQMSHSDIDVSNGTIKYWENGVVHQNTARLTRSSAYPTLWGKVALHDYNGGTIKVKANTPVLYDDVYIDNSWARVMIGNASVFSSCTHREPLIPTAWSATEITAYFNQGSFANESTVYVFVVDSTGAVSSGYAVQIGGTAADTTPPAVGTFSPADGATGVAQGTTSASFHVTDGGAGIAITTLDVGGKGCAAIGNCDAGLTATGTTADLTVTRTGLSLSYDQVWSENINVSDLATPPNAMAQYTYNFTVQSNPNPSLAITTSSLPGATVGVAYSQTLAATGGTSPYSWDLPVGTLPDGLSLSATTGVINGTPTTAGTSEFTARVTDQVPNTDNQALSIVISPATPGGQTTVEIAPSADTYVGAGDETANGAGTLINVYRWPTGSIANRIFMDFSLSSIPDNSAITSAYLYLYYDSTDSVGEDPLPVYVYPVTGLEAVYASATWNTYNGTNAWTAGADGGGGDLGSAESYMNVPGAPAGTWFSLNITNMVQSWFGGTMTNKGLALATLAPGLSNSGRYFRSVDHATVETRPYLSVTYTAGIGGNPPPPTISAPGKGRFGQGGGKFKSFH